MACALGVGHIRHRGTRTRRSSTWTLCSELSLPICTSTTSIASWQAASSTYLNPAVFPRFLPSLLKGLLQDIPRPPTGCRGVVLFCPQFARAPIDGVITARLQLPSSILMCLVVVANCTFSHDHSAVTCQFPADLSPVKPAILLILGTVRLIKTSSLPQMHN